MLEALKGSALGNIDVGHGEQIGLCQTLERIADALPNDIDPSLCRAAAVSVYKVMTHVIQVEREVLAAEIAERGARRIVDLTATLERLARENEEDLSHAEELQETLNELGNGGRTISADAIGYMLRGFFEARRRRIALEREILSALVAPSP